MRVKICGLTRAEDAAAAVVAGAWAVGVVLSPVGPRALDLEQAARVLAAVSGPVERVGVFVAPNVDEVLAATSRLPLTRVQVHGDVSPDLAVAAAVPIIRARPFASSADLARMAPDPAELTLLDSIGPAGAGGTGQTLDWDALARVAPPWPFLLAGGLTPDNVAGAIARTRPYGVDVSSGVEARPGIKDHARIASFIQNAGAKERA